MKNFKITHRGRSQTLEPETAKTVLGSFVERASAGETIKVEAVTMDEPEALFSFGRVLDDQDEDVLRADE